MTHPLGSPAGFSLRIGDIDIAPKANDIVKPQLPLKEVIELLVPKATVGHNQNLNPFGQYLRKTPQHPVLVGVAMVLERRLIDGEPQKRGSPPMAGYERKHDRRLPIGVKISPVHRHHDVPTRPHHIGYPVRKKLPDFHARIREQAVHLLHCMLGELPSGLGEPLPDRMDGQRSTGHDPHRGVRQRIHTFGMQILTKDRLQQTMNLFEPKASTLCHTVLPLVRFSQSMISLSL